MELDNLDRELLNIIQSDFPLTAEPYKNLAESLGTSEKEVLDLLIKLLETLPKDDSVEPVALAKRLAGRPLSDVTFVVREGARLCARTGKARLEQELLIQALDGTPSRSDEGQSNRIGFV